MASSLAIPFSWQGRRVLLTGHTGFKGGWLSLWLAHLGAQVRGYALDPNTTPNFFTTARIGEVTEDIRGDIRDAARLREAVASFVPEVVFHLAAQPLVRASYTDPILTFDTNVVGTAQVLEAVRRTPSVRAVVSVTTDKVYANPETGVAFREDDSLGGLDPYSSSKASAEHVSAAYRHSYFTSGPYLATARAGNVIGGGDWSSDRLIPDLIRGFQSGRPVPIRRPLAIRPWQHVLDPLHGYVLLAEHLLSADAARVASSFNFGPPEEDARPVSWIADQMTSAWGEGGAWFVDGDSGPHEAGYLKLDSARARTKLGWTSRLDLSQALDWLISWYRAQAAGEDMQSFTLQQIAAYEVL